MSSNLPADIDNTGSFLKMLSKASRVGIISHSHPDGDAAGSSYAMMNFICSLFPNVKSSRILLENDIPETLEFIRNECEKEHTIAFDTDPEAVREYASTCDLMIFLDLNALNRTGLMAEAVDIPQANKVLIDHHLNPDTGYFDLVFSRTDISSASELTFQILSEICHLTGKQMPQPCLNPLMTGISTDTNNFANSVFSSTLRSVADLLELGADRIGIL